LKAWIIAVGIQNNSSPDGGSQVSITEALTLVLHSAEKTLLCSFIAKQEQIFPLFNLSATAYYPALSQGMEITVAEIALLLLGLFYY